MFFDMSMIMSDQLSKLKAFVAVRLPEAVARARIASLFRNMAVPERTKIEPANIPELITLPIVSERPWVRIGIPWNNPA